MIEQTHITPQRRRRSVRTQMIVGSITILTFVLVLFGIFVRYVVTTTLMSSVDRELMGRTDRSFHPLPPPPRFNNQPDQDGSQNQLDEPGNGFQPGNPDQNQPPGQDQDQDGRQGGLQDDGRDPPPRMDEGGKQGQGFQSPPDQQGYDSGGMQPFWTYNQFGFRQQEDPYRPRRFDGSGASLDGSDNVQPFSLSDIKKAVYSSQPIFSTVVSGTDTLRIITRRHTRRDGAPDYVQAAYPLDQVDAAIDGVDKALIILIPIALLVAALGGLLVTKSVFERVSQMVKATSSIHANDLSERIPVSGTDEFAELADSFNALLARVEGAFIEQTKTVEQQRRFTADASHELKTPLTVIRGTTSFALSGDGILDRQATTDIDSAAASMSDLVQDLIYLARSDAGQLGRKRMQILVIEPLQKAISTVSSISPAPIEVALLDESLTVSADEGDLVRLFMNILRNASQHTPKDGKITVMLTTAETFATIRIADSGSGIASEHIPHLFERFYRIDSARSRDQGGSGLGLAICKGIVEAHGGEISVQSTLGIGTQVTVKLPIST